MMVKFRYVMLAGTFLSTLAIPYWTRASEVRSGSGAIILAQANPDDPKNKAKQKAPQQNTTPQQPKTPPRTVTPQVPQQPKGTPRTVTPQIPQPNITPRNVPPQIPQPKLGVAPSGSPPSQGPALRRGLPPVPQGQPKQVITGRQPPAGTPGPVPRIAPPNTRITTQTPGALPGPGPRVVVPGPGPRVVLPKGEPQRIPSGRKGPAPLPGPRYVNVEQLRSLRTERREGGLRVLVEPGNRFIVRDGNRVFVRHDERDRFRRWSPTARVERRGREVFTYFRRPGGYDIIDVTDANGRLLRRIRRGGDGREFVLIDNRPRIAGPGFFLALPAPVITIPPEQYIVDVDGAPPNRLFDTLDMDPIVPPERAYSLDEVRYNVELRDRMTRLDLNTINFETGSWELTPDQAEQLADLAGVIRRMLDERPNEIFLIEGHTDAVGNDDDNLSLSDRRAESVAAVLTEKFEIPPENLTTQGYGSQFLKVQTPGPSRENRRVTVRRITPLLAGEMRQPPPG